MSASSRISPISFSSARIWASVRGRLGCRFRFFTASTLLRRMLSALILRTTGATLPVLRAVVPAAVVLWSYRLGGAWILISLPAIFASGFVASVVFTARAWPWAFILGALPLLSGRWLGPAPAVLLFCGTIVGNWITLRLKGLIAPQPGGRRRMVKMIVLWAALAILFVFFYSFFSRQTAHHRRPGEGAKTNAPFLGRDAAADFQRASEQAFGECPDVECLRKAAKTCAPAHLAENYSTIEGTLASRDTFVLKLGTQCSVVGFLDFTADYSGGCRLLERTCSTLESMRSDSWDREGCSQVVLQTLTPCTRP